MLAEERAALTRQILDELPSQYRAVLILREYEDLSYTDMAEVLQCSIGTVESRLFRARKRFKDALDELADLWAPNTKSHRRMSFIRASVAGIDPRAWERPAMQETSA